MKRIITESEARKLLKETAKGNIEILKKMLADAGLKEVEIIPEAKSVKQLSIKEVIRLYHKNLLKILEKDSNKVSKYQIGDMVKVNLMLENKIKIGDKTIEHPRQVRVGEKANIVEINILPEGEFIYTVLFADGLKIILKESWLELTRKRIY